MAGGVAGGSWGASINRRAHFPQTRPLLPTTQVMPAMAAFFLEIEWAINECAHKRRYGTTEGRGAEPAEILPERRV